MQHPSSFTDEPSHGSDADGEGVRVQKPRRAAPADAVRPTRAEINLGHLRHNLRVVQRAVTSKPAEPGQEAPPRPAIFGVLKAEEKK